MLVDAGGVRLHVATQGHGGVPLVLLHGFTGSSATWDGLTPTWAKERRVLALDLLGHGRSDAPADVTPYAMEACVAQVLAAATKLGVREADWLGYSLGGRVALALALAAPDRVRRLVLESASPGIAAPEERAKRRAADEALADRIAKEGMERFVDAWMDQPLFASLRRLGPAWWARERARRLGGSPVGLANSLRALGQGAQEPLWNRLAEIRAPTLLVSGSLDTKYAAIMDRMAAAMPHARRAVVPDAGHAVHLERPEAFLQTVGPFVG